MSRSIRVPITGEVLKWAIEEGGYTVESFAKKMGTKARPVSVERLSAWISEHEQPTKTEFERMAHLLRRPTAMFLLSDPPESTLPPPFRRAPGPRPRDVAPEERIQIRWVLWLQELARDLLEERGEKAAAVPRIQADVSPERAAVRARRHLGVSMERQLGWSSKEAAFRGWREAFEAAGIFVLHLQLGVGGLRGFSWWDRYAPLAAVNSGYNTASRIFTLGHELGHLMTHSGSSCFGFGGLGKPGVAGSERWCEAFAASLLLPADDLEAYIEESALADSLGDVDVVAEVADHFNVSVRATALRLIALELAPRSIYSTIDESFEFKTGPQFGPARNRVQRRIGELGGRLTGLVVGAVEGGSLHVLESANYLRVSHTEVPALAAATSVKEAVG